MLKLILSIFYAENIQVNIPKKPIFGDFGDFQRDFEVNILQVKIHKKTIFWGFQLIGSAKEIRLLRVF